MYTELVPLIFGKLATKYPRTYGHFSQCTAGVDHYSELVRLRSIGGETVMLGGIHAVGFAAYFFLIFQLKMCPVMAIM